MNKEHNHVYRGCIFCPGVNIQELYILPGLYISRGVYSARSIYPFCPECLIYTYLSLKLFFVVFTLKLKTLEM